MLEALNVFFDTLFAESGNLILLFGVTGVVFNVFSETIKKQVYPKYTAEELAAGKVQKDMPRWVGMIFGIVSTIVFTACAVGASVTGVPHCSLIGGYFFIPVWCVAYYIWQIACMKLVKRILIAMFPKFMTGHGRPQKPKKEKVYKIPAGAKVEYMVSEEDASASVSDTVNV